MGQLFQKRKSYLKQSKPSLLKSFCQGGVNPSLNTSNTNGINLLKRNPRGC